ncbi:hypothetical protein [Gracilimonas halophila]|uniref:Uncharacterized protein n=1 Tax=Gracilimonas halophila TaxID=1834464 RepID=A0ABW5JM04_9BACT
MITDQIIEDYLNQESDHAEKIQKLKIVLLFISFIGLLVFSL